VAGLGQKRRIERIEMQRVPVGDRDLVAIGVAVRRQIHEQVREVRPVDRMLRHQIDRHLLSRPSPFVELLALRAIVGDARRRPRALRQLEPEQIAHRVAGHGRLEQGDGRCRIHEHPALGPATLQVGGERTQNAGHGDRAGRAGAAPAPAPARAGRNRIRRRRHRQASNAPQEDCRHRAGCRDREIEQVLDAERR